jgi:hypothetical protein
LCGGFFEPLSQQATQNAMGPWFIRDEEQPFHPGCSYATLTRLAEKGRITPDTVLRGPTTHQFWSAARDTPGVAHLLGQCHNCHARASADSYMCSACGAVFASPEDRQHLGLSPVRPLPGQAPARTIADSVLAGGDAPAPPTAEPPMEEPFPVSPDIPLMAATPAEAQGAAGPIASNSPRRDERRRRLLVTSLIATNVLAVLAAVIALGILLARPSGSEAVAPDQVEEAGATAGEDAPLRTPPAPAPDTPRLSLDEWETRVAGVVAEVDRESVPSLERAVAALRDLREQAPSAADPDRLRALEQTIDDLRERARDLAMAPYLDAPDRTGPHDAGPGG